MKNKLLRFAALALSLALASGTMTACDNKNNGSSKTDNSVSSGTTSTSDEYLSADELESLEEQAYVIRFGKLPMKPSRRL